MSLLFTLCWLPTMTVAHQIHYKSGHTFVFLPTPAFSVHALLSTADPHTQWMAAKLLVLIVKKSNWLKKGWPEVRNADLVSVHLRTIRTKYYACSGWPALVTLCYDNPSSSRPGVDTRAGQGWGQQRDGSLYCPKTQDSLNAQRVQFPYWSGDLELHHPSAKTDPAPRHLPVCLELCLQHAVSYTGPHTPATATAAAAASLCLTCF